MKYFALTVLLCFGACLGNDNDDPIINGGTVTNAPITKIDPPNPNTTVSPSTSTLAPTTTTNATTTKPSPSTTSKPPSNSTTDAPTTSTTTPKPVPPPTPNPTTSSPAPNSTMAPATTTASPHHDRKFDGPSFVGGIILALGLVAIGFVAFKFYKARTELNYHTL